MARFIVERTFPDRLDIPTTEEGAHACLSAIADNAEEQVAWVTTDKRKTYCVYDGPTAESITAAAAANGLSVDSVSEVRVLDPYFYTGGAT